MRRKSSRYECQACKDVESVSENVKNEVVDERLIVDVTDDAHEVEVDVIVGAVVDVNVEVDVGVEDVVCVC